MQCHGCLKVLTEFNCLKCNNCSSEYCYKCLNISVDSSKDLTAAQLASLRCPYCLNVTRRKIINKDNTPCRSSTTQDCTLEETMNASFSVVSNNTLQQSDSIIYEVSNLKTEPVTMESISKLFDSKLSLNSAFVLNLRSALRKDIEDIVAVEVDHALQHFKNELTATTDFITAEQRDLKLAIEDKDKRIKSLEAALLKTQTDLTKLQNRTATIEKISRDLNVEIHQIPESKNENVLGLFKKLCECLQIVISDNDIRACRRVAKMNTASNRPRNILVTLSSPRLRDQLLSATTRFNKSSSDDKLNTIHLGITGERRRIYLCEHLSPEAKELHSSARKFCFEKKYKFVWIRFGQIYIRKDEQSPAFHIKNIDSLNKLS
ncbi:hypothetical protein K1T71_010524 [Dendrolimus kikuchii]|uniref:Uncharacterized protein n=1 Tax=Dendrolimus kikuchii TaxID=765133 RepID=A0ACC1CRR2_9NEOP|nr:hypothetical protein K1T71_010524 [Dendrolimus kikuchii]